MTNIVSQISVHQQHELLVKLEAAGLTGELAQKVIESRGNTLAKEIVALIYGPQPQPAFPSYSVTVDYNQTVEQLVRSGRYDEANPDISSRHLPLAKRGNERVDIFIVPIEHVMSTEAVFKMIDKLDPRFRRPNVKEGLSLGAQYPELQREGPIAILCEPWRDPDGRLFVPCLFRRGSNRHLGLGWFGGGWNPIWRFAAVRK